ncbi:thiamine-phosphate synthase family protein [Natronobiforma cellulositropha]|uniref:thiamine-phosphate synthase family protein n=1 Tax=Natronobiforma cellulositropha TaxID=1679076 RepID=UPI0021D5E905|nr:thiamine-phosphate synthase family protein [Natronobiforma cellulositropha]
MSLVLPSELVVDDFLPTFRAMLATRLSDRGMTQQEIAANLGVTQAAISKYVGGGAGGDDRFRDDPDTAATADRIADGLAEGDLEPYDALAETLALVHRLTDRGPICALHEEAMPALAGLGCDLCVRGLDPDAQRERETLATVRKAARTLATIPGVAAYIPNVGTNVGMALPEASDPTDVAAIPGRIYELNGRVEIPAGPEFGASRHVSTAILAASAVDGTVLGAVNVATDDALLAAARALGIEPLEFDPDYADRGAHLRERFDAVGGVPRVVYHRGAFGIEPATYVFGESALEAVSRVGELVEFASRDDR